MVRYWVFLAFAVGYSVYQGRLRTACRSQHPFLQISRALIGVGEIALFGFGLRYLGLAEMHALYAVFPLMTLALAGVLLGEFIGLVVFGELPDLWTVVGASMVVIGGLYAVKAKG